MYTKPLNTGAYITVEGLPVCTSVSKDKPGSIFSPDIFGITDRDIYIKSACIKLYTHVMAPDPLDVMNRFYHVGFECCTTKHLFKVGNDGILTKVPDSYEKESINEKVGYGPEFLYSVWDKLNFHEAKTLSDGKAANVIAYNSLAKYKKDEIFITEQWVPPIGFRMEDQDSNMVVNELNQYLTDILRFANLIKDNQGMIPTTDLEVYLQNKVLELWTEHLKTFFGSKGKIRQKLMSRTVDSSAKSVILPASFDSKSLGDSKYEVDTAGVPIYHLINMFVFVVKKNFKTLVDILYDSNCFDEDVTPDMLVVYDQEFIDEIISQFQDNYVKVQPFKAIKADGTFGTINLDFRINDDVVINKPLSWMEFFYILLTKTADITNNFYMAVTRYPIDSDKSCQFLKPIPITLTSKYLKTVSVSIYDSIEDFPFVDEFIENNYDKKIFEQGLRVAATVVVAWNGDHDGDSVSCKPIKTKEAIEDCRNYHKNLLSVVNFTGDFGVRRGVGKSAAQTMWTISREPRKSDHSKHIPNTHEFINYLLNATFDGKVDINTLYKYTTVYGDLKKPKVSLYDTTDVFYNGETITCTVGQLLMNKTIFCRMWHVKEFEFVRETTNKEFFETMRFIKQLCIEELCTVDDVRRVMNIYCEFGLRLSTVYNATMSSTMLNPDKEFREYRDKRLNAVRDQILENKDLELLEKTINEIIEWSKKHFKDDDMIELYESGGKSNWHGDFASMQIALGALVSVVSSKPEIILNSLNEGIPFDYMAEAANTGFRGAVDRGVTTAKAGDLYKQIVNAFQSIKGYKGDCGSTHGEKVVCDPKNKAQLFNRYVLNKNGSVTKITRKNIDKYVGKEITLRSPGGCRTKGGHFCSTCIGDELFHLLNSDTVNLGLYISDIASTVLNLFMKATHDLSVHTYRIEDFNQFIYPKPKSPMFRIELDPIDGINKVYCNEDIEWKIPKSAVTPVDTVYNVLAHGSVLSSKGVQHSIVFGTEVQTNPFEIVKPDTGDNDDKKHYIFKYKEGDCFLNSVLSVRSNMTIYKMLKLYLRGSVSNLIPLEAHLITLQNTFKTNKKLSDSDLAISVMLASLARDASDINKTARETETDNYIFIGSDDLITISNTFNGVIGPDAARSLFSSMKRSFKEQTANPSPLEVAFQS